MNVPWRCGHELAQGVQSVWTLKLVLVTGGCGYIGTHTLVELLRNGYDVASLDSNVRSSERMLEGVERITGRRVRNIRVDLRDAAATEHAFSSFPDIHAILHFAAFKSVPESVARPLLYYGNNITSLVSVLRCVQERCVRNFVFSSSCSVYGDAPELPVSEDTPLGTATSPYARTKQTCEAIIRDLLVAEQGGHSQAANFVCLRYFNPAGAHPSLEIGEAVTGGPANLVSLITGAASGRLSGFTVCGADYPTRDGTCLRDYVHVCDVARAHVSALRFLEERGPGHGPESEPVYEVFNLGSGQGVTVQELILAFENVSGRELKYDIGPRRPGDVAAVHASNRKAGLWLDWKPEYGLQDMVRTAWLWERKCCSNARAESHIRYNPSLRSALLESGIAAT
jgi:UDP-glucose 4-epimerase